MPLTLNIHGRSSFVADVSMTDPAGQIVDLSTKVLVLETSYEALRIPLAPAPVVTTNRRIVLTNAQVDAMPIGPTSFVIRDETDFNMPIIVMEGMFQVRGWQGTSAQ